MDETGMNSQMEDITYILFVSPMTKVRELDT